MAQTMTLLGRANPAANTPGTLYTSPASTTTIVQSIHICNNGATDDFFNIWFVPSAGSAGISNVLIYQLPIPAANPFVMNTFPVLLAGDFIVVQCNNGSTTFTASGLQIV